SSKSVALAMQLLEPGLQMGEARGRARQRGLRFVAQRLAALALSGSAGLPLQRQCRGSVPALERRARRVQAFAGCGSPLELRHTLARRLLRGSSPLEPRAEARISEQHLFQARLELLDQLLGAAEGELRLCEAELTLCAGRSASAERRAEHGV